MNTEDKVRENRYRRWAKRLGLSLKKDKARYWSLDRQGGYMIVEPNLNAIFYGQKFDLTLDEVGEILQEYEGRISSK